MNPIVFSIGPLDIYWYGILLGVGVVLSYVVIQKYAPVRGVSREVAGDAIVWLLVGGLVGARVGHIIFYNLEFFLQNPIEILFLRHGGLSSHGMALGLLVALILFVRFKKHEWRKLADTLVLGIPLLAGFIRIGNFINSEIIGRPTNLAWAVVFERVDEVARHPSQIYESLIAFAIFCILLFLFLKYKNMRPLVLSHVFIFLYFSSRFLIECTKEYQVFEQGLTMGQYLSIPFILWAMAWFIFSYTHRRKAV